MDVPASVGAEQREAGPPSLCGLSFDAEHGRESVVVRSALALLVTRTCKNAKAVMSLKRTSQDGGKGSEALCAEETVTGDRLHALRGSNYG